VVDDLFRFPEARRNDSAVDAWLASQPLELGVVARYWLDQLRQCGPDMRELIHDGCPVACVEDAAFAYVNVFTTHVNVGFFQGASIDDPFGLLEGSGKRMRHVKLKAGVDPDAMALVRLIEDAYSLMKRRLAGH
jgi:hypothetical protein